MAPNQMAGYLDGKHEPGADVLRRIAARCDDVSLGWLLFGEGGEGPVFRGEQLGEPALEAELAKRIRREVGTVAGLLSVDDFDLRVDQILADVVARVREEVTAYARWFEYDFLLAYNAYDATWRVLDHLTDARANGDTPVPPFDFEYLELVHRNVPRLCPAPPPARYSTIRSDRFAGVSPEARLLARSDGEAARVEGERLGHGDTTTRVTGVEDISGRARDCQRHPTTSPPTL